VRHRQDRFLIFVAFVSQPNPPFLAFSPAMLQCCFQHGGFWRTPLSCSYRGTCKKTTETRTGIMHFHLRDVTSIIASYRCQLVITTLNFRDRLKSRVPHRQIAV
jgi:hypothetical protein